MDLLEREILQTLVDDSDSLTAAAIAQHCGSSVTRVTEALDELEERRLVYALRTPRLGRALRTVYSITTAGRGALESEPGV